MMNGCHSLFLGKLAPGPSWVRPPPPSHLSIADTWNVSHRHQHRKCNVTMFGKSTTNSAGSRRPVFELVLNRNRAIFDLIGGREVSWTSFGWSEIGHVIYGTSQLDIRKQDIRNVLARPLRCPFHHLPLGQIWLHLVTNLQNETTDSRCKLQVVICSSPFSSSFFSAGNGWKC